MKFLWLVVVFGLGACQSGTGAREGDAAPPSDAARGLDARRLCESGCNPVAQTGCQEGEKCTAIRFDDEPDPCWLVRCVPDGELSIGEPCAIEPIEPGFSSDDCAAGGVCVDGLCRRMCTGWPDSCSADQVCALVPELFGDLPGVGVCEPSCDPLAQDCPQVPEHPYGTGCYPFIGSGKAQCLEAVAETEGGQPGVQGESCAYLNTCAVGFACVLPNATVPDENECAYLCDTEATGGPTCADGPGDTYACVAISGGVHPNVTEVDPRIGLCVDCNVRTDLPGCQ